MFRRDTSGVAQSPKALNGGTLTIVTGDLVLARGECKFSFKIFQGRLGPSQC
jgi:hypothetical protein